MSNIEVFYFSWNGKDNISLCRLWAVWTPCRAGRWQLLCCLWGCEVVSRRSEAWKQIKMWESLWISVTPSAVANSHIHCDETMTLRNDTELTSLMNYAWIQIKSSRIFIRTKFLAVTFRCLDYEKYKLVTNEILVIYIYIFFKIIKWELKKEAKNVVFNDA